MIFFFANDKILHKPRKNHTVRTRIGVSHEVQSTVLDPSTLPSCSKTFLYKFVNPWGMGSEIGLYTMAAVAASAFNYTILIDDSAWVYGRLQDTPRTVFKNVGLNQADHVYATWEETAREGFTQYILSLVDRRAVDVNSVWNLMNHREERTVLPAAQNLHYSMISLFDAKSEALRRIWRPNKRVLDEIRSMKKDLNNQMMNLISTQTEQRNPKSSIVNFDELDSSPMVKKIISVHFRLGDKKAEEPLWSPSANVGMVSAFSNPKPFFDIIRSFVPDWKTSNHLPALFVFSDDAKTALSLFEDHQSFYYPSERFQLITSPSSTKLTEDGHDQKAFLKASLEVRQNLTIALIRDMTFAVDESEAIVCSSISNDVIGPKASVRSVDVRWHPTSMANEFTDMSLNMIQDRRKILEMIPILSVEEKNYIDL
ncbi:hypothetical protein DFH28DRAFT_1091832 [Melampsora americana]|nr:hypothetical protein DFH28DRAFT_1091832 [Melampsora americana]